MTTIMFRGGIGLHARLIPKNGLSICGSESGSQVVRYSTKEIAGSSPVET